MSCSLWNVTVRRWRGNKSFSTGFDRRRSTTENSDEKCFLPRYGRGNAAIRRTAKLPYDNDSFGSVAGIGEQRLAVLSQFSPGAGSCREIFMMDMPVDVHIGIRTQHATRVVAFDQAQFGQHLHIFVHPLDVAASSPFQFAHRQRTLPQQGGYQSPAAFSQPAKKSLPAARSSMSRPGNCRPVPTCPFAARRSASRATR